MSASFSHKIICLQNGAWYWYDRQRLLFFHHYSTEVGQWSCITYVLCWTTRVVCSFWDQNCQIWWLWGDRNSINLVVHWLYTTGTLAHRSLYYNSENGPRPSECGAQGSVVWVSNAMTMEWCRSGWLNRALTKKYSEEQIRQIVPIPTWKHQWK